MFFFQFKPTLTKSLLVFQLKEGSHDYASLAANCTFQEEIARGHLNMANANDEIFSNLETNIADQSSRMYAAQAQLYQVQS